jgi:hypothetical protein
LAFARHLAPISPKEDFFLHIIRLDYEKTLAPFLAESAVSRSQDTNPLFATPPYLD